MAWAQCLTESFHSTAWVGSLAIALTFFFSALTSGFITRFGARLVTLSGGVICIVSFLLTSFAPNMYVMYFTYSVTFGFGASCLLMSNFLILPKYFLKRSSLATGLVAAGSGVGIMAMAPFLQSLLNLLGWRGTFRVMAAVYSLILLVGLTFNPNVKKESGTAEEQDDNAERAVDEVTQNEDPPSGKFIDTSVWIVPTFLVDTLSICLAQLGHQTPRIHIVSSYIYLP